MTKILSLILLLGFLNSCTQNPKVTESASTVILENKLSIDTAQINLDGVKVSPNNFRILLDNDSVRMVEYSLKPGQKDQWHTHPPKSGYVLSGGTLKIYRENEEPFIVEEKTGDTFWSGYVGKHYDENIGNTTVTIILTEVKYPR